VFLTKCIIFYFLQLVPGSSIDTYVDVPPGKEKALLRAIAMQPVSVAIQGSQFIFQFYKSGVLTDTSCGASGAIDHGVLAVGYGTDLDTQEPYILVKNSWGESWGDAGYIKIGRNNKNKFGICSILKLASFPIMK
jgi:Papain family cysteine protease